MQNEYVFFGGRRVAQVPATGTPFYYAEDFLGSSRVMTQSTGAVCYDADFTPFGAERTYTNTCPQNYKFEGKERDAETNNDDFGAREYSWRVGRWLSSDWSAVPVAVPYANLTNPQTLNLYSMVGDDPESFADLDGHECPTCPTPTLPDPTAADWELIEEAGAAGTGISFSAILTGAALVFIPAHIFAPTVGQSDADEGAQIEQASQDRARQNGGVDPQLGQARGAGEEKSQSDDAQDKTRTNGGIVKPDKGPGSVPKDQRDPKRSATKAERQQLLDGQKGICPWCGKPTTVDKTAAHHVKRHADGGRTKKSNLKAVCQQPCHVEIHN